MGWEERRNGRSYYYSKCREGGRVVSRYVGAGELAVLCAAVDAELAGADATARAAATAERDLDREMFDGLRRIAEGTRDRTRRALEAAGCRLYAGRWRKRRPRPSGPPPAGG